MPLTLEGQLKRVRFYARVAGLCLIAVMCTSCDKQQTSTVLTAIPDPSFGGSVTFAATVTGQGGIPTGWVQFRYVPNPSNRDISYVIGATTLNASGVATFATSSLSVGANPIVAIYLGDSKYAPSFSEFVIQQVISKIPNTQTSIASMSNPAVYGSSVSFVATVLGGPGIPTGTVFFFDNLAQIGSGKVNGGHAEFATSGLALGTHPIQARYYPNDSRFDSSVSGKISQVISPNTTASVSVSSNPAIPWWPVVLTAIVTSPAGTPSGSVVFLDGASTLGSASLNASGSATLNASGFGPGTHTLAAQYQPDNSKLTPSSSPDYAEQVSLSDAIVPTDSSHGLTAAPAPGRFAVSADGAATYAYPIWVPQGRRMIQPTLSVSYNSRRGNGLFGVGWSLQGLSSISRCKRDLARDDYNAAISFARSDALCLDGERLVAVPSILTGVTGDYGAADTEYRTEEDHFVRVIEGDADAQGPVWFEVQFKDGRSFFYGTTPGSRLEGQPYVGPMARLNWSLSEVRDRFGNNLMVHYCLIGNPNSDCPDALKKDTNASEQLPAWIEYTGTVDGSLQPLRKVVFNYEPNPRPDAATSYVGGLAIQSRHRMAGIDVLGPDSSYRVSVLKSYRFLYYRSQMTGRSLLSQIQECDAANVCAPPAFFSYSEESNDGFVDFDTGIQANVDAAEHIGEILVGDLNGDGCDDFIYVTRADNTNSFRRADYRLSSCYDAVAAGTAPFPSPSQPGLFELSPGSPRIPVPPAVFQNSSPDNCTADLSGICSFQELLTVDLDMDGRADLLGYAVTNDGLLDHWRRQDFDIAAYLASPVATSQWSPYSGLFQGGEDFTSSVSWPKTQREPLSFRYRKIYIGDLNGDGLPDLIHVKPNGWTYQLNQGRASTGPAGATCVTLGNSCLAFGPESPLYPGFDNGSTQTNLPVPIIDINQDGKADVRLRDANFSDNYVAFSLDPSGQNVWARGIGLTAGKMDRFLDVNGDGLPDFLSYAPYQGWRVAINTGAGFTPSGYFPALPAPDGPAQDPHVTLIFDYDGDGTQDFLYNNGSQYRVLRTGLNYDIPLVCEDPNGQNQRPIPLASDAAYPSPVPRYDLKAFDANGDGLMDLIQVVNGDIHVYLRKGETRDLLTSVSDRGGEFTVTYSPISSAKAYQATVATGTVGSSGSTYVHNRGPLVVASYTAPVAGWGLSNAYTCYYTDARSSLKGRGWLGFGSVSVTDQQTGTTFITTYDNSTMYGSAYPYAMKPQTETVWYPMPENGPAYVNHRLTTYSYRVSGYQPSGTYISVQLGEEVQQEWEEEIEDVALLRTLDTVFTYDYYGNLLTANRKTGDGFHDSAELVYDYTPDRWLVARPRRATASSNTPANLFTTRTASYSTSPDTGAVLAQVVEPAGNETTYRATSYFLDSHGVSQGWVSSNRKGDDVRQTFISLDPLEDLYPISVTNSLDQTERLAFHPGFGDLVDHQDANGLVHQWQYDGFGRMKHAASPDGAATSINYGFPLILLPCGTAVECAAPGITINSTGSGGDSATVTYDPYMYEAQRSVKGFDGNPLITGANYNSQSLVSETEGPCLPADVSCRASHIEKFTWDSLGRLRSVQHGDGTVRSSTYLGLKASRSDESGNQTYSLENQLGLISKSVSLAEGNREIATTFAYEPFGQLHAITDAYGNITETTHDVKGRPIKVHDPDSSERSFAWTAFDQPYSEFHRGAFKYYNWDSLGRILSISSQNWAATFTWDTAANGIGKLASAASGNSGASYSYDPLGHPKTASFMVDGGTYTFGYTFDDEGRLSTIAYPSSGASPPFAIQRKYSPFGFVSQTVDANTGNQFWQVNSMSERLQVTNQTDGNGYNTQRMFNPRGQLTDIVTTGNGSTLQSYHYSYYPNGSVKTRSNLFPRYTLTETFKFDPLDRLRQIDSLGFAPPPSIPQLFHQSLNYDDIGNLKEKVTSGAPTLTYQYGQNGAGPHALTQVNADVYGYNGIGDQISRPGATITYDSSDLPLTITQNQSVYSFEYDAYHQRAAKHYPTGDSTVYAGGLYEKRTQGNTVTNVYYIPGPDGAIAAQVQPGAQSASVDYIFTDNLASVQAVAPANGAAEQLWYEAFGQWVDPTNPANPVTPGFTNVTQGFTSQSEDVELGLVNMKGRIYDPKLAHFLTPDPFLQNPRRSESLNRYSYAWNNPLKWVDPSGFQDVDSGISGSYDSPDSGIDFSFDFGGGYAGWAPAPSLSRSVSRSTPASPTRPVPAATFSDNGNYQSTLATPPGAFETSVVNGLISSVVGALRVVLQPQSLGYPGGAPPDIIGGDLLGRLESRLRLPYPEGTGPDAARVSERLWAAAFNLAIGAGVAELTEVATVGEMGVESVGAPEAVIEDKFDYLFGRGSGNTHNIDRSAQLQSELLRVGISDNPEGRAILQEHFEQVLADPSNKIGLGFNKYGSFETRESLLPGPGGFLGLRSTWQVMDNGELWFITARLFRPIWK